MGNAYGHIYSDRLLSSGLALRKACSCRDVFQNGKTLPIDRGKGISQPIMHTAAAKAAAGEWVHVFPESKISYTGCLLPLKRGIGKVICDSLKDNPLCVLQFNYILEPNCALHLSEPITTSYPVPK